MSPQEKNIFMIHVSNSAIFMHVFVLCTEVKCKFRKQSLFSCAFFCFYSSKDPLRKKNISFWYREWSLFQWSPDITVKSLWSRHEALLGCFPFQNHVSVSTQNGRVFLFLLFLFQILARTSACFFWCQPSIFTELLTRNMIFYLLLLFLPSKLYNLYAIV